MAGLCCDLMSNVYSACNSLPPVVPAAAAPEHRAAAQVFKTPQFSSWLPSLPRSEDEAVSVGTLSILLHYF